MDKITVIVNMTKLRKHQMKIVFVTMGIFLGGAVLLEGIVSLYFTVFN